MAKAQTTKVECVCQHCKRSFVINGWEARRGRGVYCGQDCYHASRCIPIEDQFRRGVGPTNEHGCILWSGLTDHHGRGVVYSTLRPPQRIFIASRLAWEFGKGPIPEGLCVLHNCPGGDNPLCVNVEHLFLGTQLDNIADMAKKERQANRKLTHEAVRLIRSRYRAGGVSQQQLADEHGVDQTTISKVVLGQSWAVTLHMGE
jgi:hypothetical protein